MKIADKNTMRRYHRDNITSYLLSSEETPGANFITTSLVEMAIGRKQSLRAHETGQCYFLLEVYGMMTLGNETRELTGGMSIFIPLVAPHGQRKQKLQYLFLRDAGQITFAKSGREPGENELTGFDGIFFSSWHGDTADGNRLLVKLSWYTSLRWDSWRNCHGLRYHRALLGNGSGERDSGIVLTRLTLLLFIIISANLESKTER